MWRKIPKGMCATLLRNSFTGSHRVSGANFFDPLVTWAVKEFCMAVFNGTPKSLGYIPQDRSEKVQFLIDGVDRYNPDNVFTFEDYLAQQCQDGTYDSLSNLALLKL